MENETQEHEDILRDPISGFRPWLVKAARYEIRWAYRGNVHSFFLNKQLSEASTGTEAELVAAWNEHAKLLNSRLKEARTLT